MKKRNSGVARKTYVLRTCNSDLSSSHGFVWPSSGAVKAPDWDAGIHCGNGLHGIHMGEGDAGLLDWLPDAKWLVVEIDAATMIDLSGKVKFPSGVVVFCGDRLGATSDIIARGADPAKVLGGTATAGYGGTATAGVRGTATAGNEGTATAGVRGTATAGDGGTATAGYGGTATAGNEGTATAGYSGTATAGVRGTATAGDGGTATAGYGGTATAGNEGTATAGYSGTATAGVRGTATAGNEGTATAGVRGTATAGYGGTATAGVRGTIIIRWWDGRAERYRVAVGDVGDGGIEPNVAYRVVDGKLAKVSR